MLFTDFLFSFIQSLKIDLAKKKYYRVFKKLLYYPYKFLLDKIRQTFLIKKNDLDKNLKLRILKNMKLDELFFEFNADKGSKFKMNKRLISSHNYTPFYEKYFSNYKNKSQLKVLEVGSLRGGATASFFYYFNNPEIFCADINPFQIEVFSKKIRKLFVDTQSKKSISSLSSFIGEEFDIIIDDGSHNIKDQIVTLNILFKNLKRNGIYVIEDASQYVASKNLNQDNLDYGAKEILFSVIKNDNLKIKYLLQDDEKKLRNEIKNLHIENGNYILNKINISEIIFIEKC